MAMEFSVTLRRFEPDLDSKDSELSRTLGIQWSKYLDPNRGRPVRVIRGEMTINAQRYGWEQVVECDGGNEQDEFCINRAVQMVIHKLIESKNKQQKAGE